MPLWPVSRGLCEVVVLATTSITLLYRWCLASDEEIRRHAWCLILCVVLACILEYVELPMVLSKDGSSGLYYGCVPTPAILLGILVKQRKFGKGGNSTVVLGELCSDEIIFALLILVFLSLLAVVRKVMRFDEGTVMQTVPVLAMTFVVVKYFLSLTVSWAVIGYVVAFIVCVPLASRHLPNCFSCGELMLLMQIIFAFFFLYGRVGTESPVAIISTHVACFVMVFFAIVSLTALSGLMSTLVFYSSGILCFVCMVSVIIESLPTNLIYWCLDFLCNNYPNRQALLTFWLLELTCCGAYVGLRASDKKSSTTERKLFHVFVLMTFTPGVMYDVQLLVLCCLAANSLLMNLELMRVLDIAPLSPMLKEKFQIFLDPQDRGKLILTPIFLLLGQSLPVFAACFDNVALLGHEQATIPTAICSGVLSVGVGDTAASVIGSKYGRTKWPGSNKTVEGTAAAVSSQLLFMSVLVGCQCESTVMAITTVVAVSLIEAFTRQIDNLVLPVYMYFLLNFATL